MNQLALEGMPMPVHHPSGSSDEFYTPWPLFRELDEEFHFTVDVCATRESAKCRHYFSPEKDGLAQSWAGERAFCNPPYSNIGPWVMKAHLETLAEFPAELVVMLLPAWTDRRWWHDFVEHTRDGRDGRTVETRFLRGRVRFGFPGHPEGEGGGTFPSVLVIWRPQP